MPNHTIGVRREEKVPETPGPGEYRHENADGLTKERVPGYEWHKNQGRPVPVVDPNNGPGNIEDNRKFGDDANDMTIGVRREERVPVTPGPGEYRHEDADGQTKPRVPAHEWHKYPGRPEPEVDPNNGPGHLVDNRRFGDDA